MRTTAHSPCFLEMARTTALLFAGFAALAVTASIGIGPVIGGLFVLAIAAVCLRMLAD